MLLDGSDLNNSGKFPVAGGNIEIIKLYEQNQPALHVQQIIFIGMTYFNIFNEIEQINENNQSTPHEETVTSPSEMKHVKLSDLGLISITI